MTTETSATGAHLSTVDGRYAWFRLIVSVLFGTISGIGMWAFVLVLPAVQSDLGIDRASASLPFTTTMVGFAIGNLIFGRFVDRMGMAVPAITSAFLLSGGFIASAYTPTIVHLAVVHGLLIGIGTGAGFGPLFADISHWFVRYRGIAVAAVATGNYVAGAVWPTFLKIFFDTNDWRATYIGIGITCIVTMLPLAFLLHRRTKVFEHGQDAESIADSSALRTITLSPQALQTLLAVAGVGCCVAMAMPQVHIVAYCVDLGYGSSRGAEMLSLMLTGGIVSRLASGVLADRIGGVRTVLLSSVLQCIGLFFYLPFDGLMSLYVVSLIFGLSQGGIVPGYAIIVREYLPAHQAGHRIGVVLMATMIGMAVGGLLSGWIYDLTGSYQAAFLNGIAWNLLNISILAIVLWRTHRPTAVPA